MSGNYTTNKTPEEVATSKLLQALRQMRKPTDDELNQVAHAIAEAFNSTHTDPNERNRIHFAFLGGFWRQKVLGSTADTQPIKV